jgi:ribosome-associated translation inhibitor RaiA
MASSGVFLRFPFQVSTNVFPREQPAMQTQAQISFDDIPIDDAVRDAAIEHIDQLESFSNRITGCHVVIAQPHRHHRNGRLYSVRVDVHVPGAELIVNRDHHLDHAHEDVFMALRDAFAAARRRLEDHVRRLRGVEKMHEARGLVAGGEAST